MIELANEQVRALMLTAACGMATRDQVTSRLARIIASISRDKAQFARNFQRLRWWGTFNDPWSRRGEMKDTTYTPPPRERLIPFWREPFLYPAGRTNNSLVLKMCHPWPDGIYDRKRAAQTDSLLFDMIQLRVRALIIGKTFITLSGCETRGWTEEKLKALLASPRWSWAMHCWKARAYPFDNALKYPLRVDASGRATLDTNPQWSFTLKAPHHQVHLVTEPRFLIEELKWSPEWMQWAEGRKVYWSIDFIHWLEAQSQIPPIS